MEASQPYGQPCLAAVIFNSIFLSLMKHHLIYEWLVYFLNNIYLHQN